jgi:hypothetical protein
MNYDLCDLLNRKMENANGYMAQNFPNRSIFKNQNIVDEFFETLSPEDYLEVMGSETCDHQCFAFWIYRRITRELANLSYSNSPALDIMYFSGCMKVIIANNKAMYLETCIRPSLDQMFAIKDLELKHLKDSGKVIWRIVERKKKLNFYEGIGVNDLHGFKWARIK